MRSRRDELVVASLAELSHQGVTGMSLRPLARALGTSDRMLIHYFGTREALVSAVLAEAFDRLAGARVHRAGAGTVRGLWTQLTSQDALPAVRLYLEASALAHGNVAWRQMLTPLTVDWLGRLEQWLVEDGVDPVRAPDLAGIVSACVDGCLLRLGVDGASEAIDAVVAELESVVEAAAGITPVQGWPLTHDNV